MNIFTIPKTLQDKIDHAWSLCREHGDYERWHSALTSLPALIPSYIDLKSNIITIGRPEDIDAKTAQHLKHSLLQLHPWRKGPFELFGIHIDSEWRSDLKWNRLSGAISDLGGRKILDVGCGSGYHLWRMYGSGAKLVIGIDPTPLFSMQFLAIQHFIRNDNIQFWPIGIEDIPVDISNFDTVFSMGVLYHRRSPIDHLLKLKSLMKPEGELVLETLIVEGDATTCLLPEDRYAKMHNVWFIPSIPMLVTFLTRSGFRDIRIIDISPTGLDEQRRTDWMQFESLASFLDERNPSRTVEGYPAPVRAVLVAKKPA